MRKREAENLISTVEEFQKKYLPAREGSPRGLLSGRDAANGTGLAADFIRAFEAQIGKSGQSRTRKRRR